MFGKHKFHVGDRVRPSKLGIESRLFWRYRRMITEGLFGGKVVKVDEFNCPTVLWDVRKTASAYHADFVEPDRRRNR